MDKLKNYGPLAISIMGILIVVGAYKNTVDDLKERVAKLEAQPRVVQTPVDPRLAECARLAKQAYGDGSVTVMDDRTNILMLRLGCDAK
jgi:hypothetical protein